MRKNNLPPVYDPDYLAKRALIEIERIKKNTMTDPMPETFAEMKSLLEKGVARHLTVQHDEFQGVDQVPYYFNGVKLFAWGVEIDESEQPTFN